jgi:hypothetical protein
MPRLERDIQREGEAALKAAFGQDCRIWTADTGGFVPYRKVQAAIARIAQNPSRWRIVLATLHPFQVGVTGGADTQGAIHGKWVGIEWKRPSQRQRGTQVTFEREIKRAGGIYIVCTSPEQAVEGVIAALGLDAERDEILDRAFGPRSRIGRLRTRRAALKAPTL